MTSEAERALSACWWLVDELVRGGLTDACVSPGSRSTPLALALWRHPGVRVHVHLDERAAAFFALGIAKASGRPVAVACTSGTAAAEFLPAVVEASMARVPVVVLTADRPPELRGVGANQTIDQVDLYGRFPKWSDDAAVPGDRADERYWRHLADEALGQAERPPPGSVHLNLPFREPLVPERDVTLMSEAPSPRPRAERLMDRVDVERLAAEFASSERGVVLAGSLRLPAPSVVELADAAGWPLLAEPTSGLRVPGSLAAGQFLLANEAFAASHAPEVVLQVGAAPTSRAGLALAASAERLVIVDPDHLVADPARHASLTIHADPDVLALQVLERASPRDTTPWLAAWREADASARATVDGLIDGWEEPYEGRVARDVAAAIPDASTLIVGSSMPVRDLDAYMGPRTGLRVLGNRGTSGIDGFVSTALGVATAGDRTLALCGDLTLLHDVGSLLWSARSGPGVVFVVPNNDGGTIFSFLAQKDLPELDALFTTPHGLDLGAVCAAAGAGYCRIERAADLAPAVERAMAAGGVEVVEVPIDRASNVRRHAEVASAVAAALGA